MTTRADAGWLAPIGRRIEASRRRPLRIRDLIAAVLITALVLGLGRFILDVFSGPRPSPFLAWLAVTSLVGLVAALGVIAALTLGRVSNALYAWGTRRSGTFAGVALTWSVLADLASVGLLLAIALGVTLFLVLSAMAYAMSLVE